MKSTRWVLELSNGRLDVALILIYGFQLITIVIHLPQSCRFVSNAKRRVEAKMQDERDRERDKETIRKAVKSFSFSPSTLNSLFN